MVTVTNKSREFSEVEIYLMTVSPSMISVKTLEDGAKINVRGILEFEEVKEDTGEVVNIVSIIDDEKNVYSFQSKTFKRSLNDIGNDLVKTNHLRLLRQVVKRKRVEILLIASWTYPVSNKYFR